MPRFKSIIFYQNSPKIKLFLKKNAKFLSAGNFAPRPPCLRRLGALPPDPHTQPPLRISAYVPGNFVLFVVICVFVGFVLSNFFLIVQLQTLL